jgi:hypothetical protein
MSQSFLAAYSKYVFQHADCGIVEAADPLPVKEARKLGLTPLHLYGIIPAGTPINWVTLSREPRSLSEVLEEAWAGANGSGSPHCKSTFAGVRSTSSRGTGSLKGIAFPAIFDEQPRELGSVAPSLGQHNEEILTEFGWTPEQIERLKADGIIFTPA